MERATYKSVIGLSGLLSLVLLLLTSPVHAGESPENMELKALSGQAAQLQQRFDQNPSDYEALQGLGIVYHFMAVKDSKAYAKKAVQYLEQAYQKKPDDNVALCYLGSAYSMLAKDAWNPISRLADVNKGVGYMDKAVRKDPDNITVRLTRANNSRALPKFLGRRSIAYEDFEHLTSLFEKGLKAPSPLKASVYRRLEALYKEDGNMAQAQKNQLMAETLEKEK